MPLMLRIPLEVAVADVPFGNSTVKGEVRLESVNKGVCVKKCVSVCVSMVSVAPESHMTSICLSRGL